MRDTFDRGIILSTKVGYFLQAYIKCTLLRWQKWHNSSRWCKNSWIYNARRWRPSIDEYTIWLHAYIATPTAPATATAATFPTMMSIPNFAHLDSTSELWKDYWARFNTVTGANSVREEELAHVFLTSQTTTVYKLLSTLAGHVSRPRPNTLTSSPLGGGGLLQLWRISSTLKGPSRGTGSSFGRAPDTSRVRQLRSWQLGSVRRLPNVISPASRTLKIKPCERISSALSTTRLC